MAPPNSSVADAVLAINSQLTSLGDELSSNKPPPPPPGVLLPEKIQLVSKGTEPPLLQTPPPPIPAPLRTVLSRNVQFVTTGEAAVLYIPPPPPADTFPSKTQSSTVGLPFWS